MVLCLCRDLRVKTLRKRVLSGIHSARGGWGPRRTTCARVCGVSELPPEIAARSGNPRRGAAQYACTQLEIKLYGCIRLCQIMNVGRTDKPPDLYLRTERHTRGPPSTTKRILLQKANIMCSQRRLVRCASQP